MELNCDLTLSHATMRGEKAGGEDGPVATDCTIKGVVLAEALAGLFSSAAAFTRSLGNYYGKNDEPISADVKSLELSTDLEDVALTLKAPVSGEVRLQTTGAKLNQVVLEPLPGRAVQISARLQFYPTDEQWAALPHLLRKTHSLSLTGGKKPEPKPAAKKGEQASLDIAADQQGPQPAASQPH